MIGLNTATFRHLSVDDILNLMETNNLRAIEWAGDAHVPIGDLEVAEKVAKKSQESGISYTSYGSYLFLAEDNNFSQLIATAQALNAANIRVWAGKYATADASEDYRHKVVLAAKELAKLCQKTGLNLGIEYHQGTLTDSPENAKKLIQAIACDNVSLYWQPAENLTVDQRTHSLEDLLPYVSNVHVFHWEDYHNRFSLAEGENEWLGYLNRLKTSPRNYFFEFVKDDSIDQFEADVDTLKEWKENL